MFKGREERINLINGECLEEMKNIPEGSIDAIICDPPYGTTACKWDSVIDFELMWEQLNRIIKPNGAIVLFGSEPFSSALRMSNIKNFKYDWIWEKDNGTNFFNVNHQPFKVHEIISIFSLGGTSYIASTHCKYNPQKTTGKKYNIIRGSCNHVYGSDPKGYITKNNGDRYPRSVIKFGSDKGLHPTQKPIALMEYLIKTYTNENETVLDFTMGSGSTGVACKNTNRKFIGIELDKTYFEIATKRINDAFNEEVNDV